MQSPQFPRYLVPPKSKYSSQHPVLKDPQLPFLPQCQRLNFTPIQKTGKLVYLDNVMKFKRNCVRYVDLNLVELAECVGNFLLDENAFGKTMVVLWRL